MEFEASLTANRLFHVPQEMRDNLTTNSYEVEVVSDNLLLVFKENGDQSLSDNNNVYLPKKCCEKIDLRAKDKVRVELDSVDEIRVFPKENRGFDVRRRKQSDPYRASVPNEENSLVPPYARDVRKYEVNSSDGN